MMWLTTMIAMATTPTNADGTLDVGGGAIGGLSWSADREVAVGVTAQTTEGVVVIVDSWTVLTVDPGCAVTAMTTATIGTDLFVYAGCNNGELHAYYLDDETLVRDEDDDGNVVWQFLDVDGGLQTAPIVALAWDGETTEPRLFAYAGDVGSVHIVDPVQGLLDEQVVSGWPWEALETGFVDAAIDRNIWYILHGNGRASNVTLSTAVFANSPLVVGLQYDLDAVTPGNGRLWGVETSSDTVVAYLPAQGSYQTPLLDVGGVTALDRNTVTDDDFMIFAGEQEIAVHVLSNGLFGDVSMPAYQNTEPGYAYEDVLAGSEYSLLGTLSGELQVMSARPWVDELALSSTEGLPGDEVSVSFRVSQASNWALYVGGDRTGTGEVLASGATNGPDVEVTTSFVVADSWREGSNRIYALAASGNLEQGHARATYVVDTPPDALVLTDANIGFASGGLELSFVSLEDEDITTYEVCVSDVEFDPTAFDTGCPDAPEDFDGPVTLQISEAGGTVTTELEPLVNGTTYYIAVRAIDTGGQESPLSNVITGVPEPVFTASQNANEQGGCSTSPMAPLSGLMVGLVALLGRRRTHAVAAGLLVSTAAAADDKGKGDMSPQVGNFELRYGPYLSLDDTNITDTFERGHEQLQVELGPQLTRFFEVDLQFGFYQELARAESAGGEDSSVRTMLTSYQLGLSGTARLHILDEQLIVPFAKLGMDYVPFAELTDDATGGKDKVSGAKVGHHYAFGANVLLDVFAKGRASLLEAQTGINDTYITFEYRRQNIDSRNTPWAPADGDGFDFSGTMFTVGLKLDY